MPQRDPVWDTARTYEPDRYLSALYAAEPARGRLMALAAFSGEIARIPITVHEPLLAEIRLQWWRDALAALAKGERTGHPAADHLGPDIAAGLLPAGLLSGMIDAAGEHGWSSELADPQVLRSHLNKSHGAAFALAARALGARHSEPLETAVTRAGFAYGLARLIASGAFREPAHRDQLIGQCRHAIPEASGAVARLDSALLPGFLPLAMANAYLDRAAGASATSLALAVGPLQRWWRLWRAQLRDRIG